MMVFRVIASDALKSVLVKKIVGDWIKVGGMNGRCHVKIISTRRIW